MTRPAGAKMAALCVGSRMMESAVTSLLDLDLSEAELGETIQVLREHGALRGEGSFAALSSILNSCSSRLMSASTRIEGLSLLSLVVEESATDVFQIHCVSWIRSILQVIQSQDPPRVVGLAVFVLRSLLAHSSALPELAREISTNQIPGLLTSLLGLRHQCLIPALEGIRSCLISYPRACGSLRGKLTVFFLSLLDVENNQMQELACQCFSLLPSLGSGFTQGVKHTENWERQIQSVLCSLHSIFKQLYQGAETDFVRYEGPGSELELPPLEEDEDHHVLQLLSRFSALGQCVCLLLREQFPAPVRVPVSDILSLICRAVNVSPKNLSWQGEESLKLLFLPRIQRTVLEILDATIIACGPRLLPFSALVCRLFPQLLSSWAAVRGATGIPTGHEKPYSSLRGSVYNVLERWVSVCGISSGVLQGPAHHSDILLAHMLSDITPAAESLKISGFVQLGAKKQKVSEIGENDFQGQRKREVNANSELCSAALRGLCCIVLHCGSLIKEDTHRRLQELSIPLLIRLQQGSDNWLGPYVSSNCRKELYRLLLCLTLTPNPRLPAPLHCAVRIFRGGVTEESIQVSMFCTEALAICRVLIHPRVPSLQHPLPTPSHRPPQTGDALIQRPPAPPPTFPVTPISNHLPIRPPAPTVPNEPLIAPAGPSPTPEETFGGRPRRAVFIHFDKEEASDVEISLESDSDDSVVIVPEGLFPKPAPKQEPSPPSVKPPPEEPAEPPAQPVAPTPSTAPPPLVCAGPSPVPLPIPEITHQHPPEGNMTVININSSDDEEGEEEEEEGEYDEEDYYDEEEEDLEELEEEEYDEDEEGLTEEEEEEEDMDEEGEEEEEDEGDEEEGLMHEDMQLGCVTEELDDIAEPIMQAAEPEEGPPRLSPIQEEEQSDTGLVMLVESEERETPNEEPPEKVTETEAAESPPPPPVLTPPPPPELPSEIEDSTLEPPPEPAKEPVETPTIEEPVKEIEPEKEILQEKEKTEKVEDNAAVADADTMLADFIDCPPDDEKPPEQDK